MAMVRVPPKPVDVVRFMSHCITYELMLPAKRMCGRNVRKVFIHWHTLGLYRRKGRVRIASLAPSKNNHVIVIPSGKNLLILSKLVFFSIFPKVLFYLCICTRLFIGKSCCDQFKPEKNNSKSILDRYWK